MLRMPPELLCSWNSKPNSVMFSQPIFWKPFLQVKKGMVMRDLL
jgi:hypothetical protein